MLLLLHHLNWALLHLGLHCCPLSVSWGPHTAQYSDCPMRDFRLPPRCGCEQRSSRLIRSVYSLRINREERCSHLYCPLETDFEAMAAPVRNLDKNRRDYQVFLSHFKPVYTGLWFFQTWSLISINRCHIKHLHDSKPTGTRRVSKSLWHCLIQYAIIIFHVVNFVLYINRPNLAVFGSAFRSITDCPCTVHGGVLRFLQSRSTATRHNYLCTFEMLHNVC